jgi:adenylate cyclase
VRVYELLAKAGPLSSQLEQALRSYAAGLEAYRKQIWDEAQAFFWDASTMWPEDEVSRTMAGRCELHQKMPPPEAWDGVFEQVYKK